MLAISIILIVAAIFLTVAVLMQHGKSHNLSGTIAGASETFFGKSKATTIDKKLSILTTVVAIIFVVLVLVAYLIQGIGNGATDNQIDGSTTKPAVTTGTNTTGTDTTGTDTTGTDTTGTDTTGTDTTGTDTASDSVSESDSVDSSDPEEVTDAQ